MLKKPHNNSIFKTAKANVRENCCSLWQNQKFSAFERVCFMVAVDHSTSHLYVLTQKLLKIHVCSFLMHLLLF